MPWTKRLELALRALTVVAVLTAAAALLWPASPPSAEIRPFPLVAGPTVGLDVVGEPEVSRTVAQRNIFSPTRSAPAVRYRPAGASVDTESATGAAGGGDVEGGVPALFGILPGVAGATALLRLDPGVAEARLYRAGDRGGRYRVDEIGDRSVVLSGPAGRVELRLAAPEEPR